MAKGKALFTTSCGHQFHFECIMKCTQNDMFTCPLCRKSMSQLMPSSSSIPKSSPSLVPHSPMSEMGPPSHMSEMGPPLLPSSHIPMSEMPSYHNPISQMGPPLSFPQQSEQIATPTFSNPHSYSNVPFPPQQQRQYVPHHVNQNVPPEDEIEVSKTPEKKN